MPWYGMSGFFDGSFSTGGVSSLKVTVPGPRNLLHVTVTGWASFAFETAPEEPEGIRRSSASHTRSGRGCPAFAATDVTRPAGPLVAGPLSVKERDGGSLPTASPKGETS